MNSKVRLQAAIAIVGACALVVTGIGTVSAAAPSDPVFSSGGHELSSRKQQRALRYWTPERMRAAESPSSARSVGRAPVNGLAEASGGKPGFVAGTGPGRRRTSGTVAPADAYTYPFPYTAMPLPGPLRKTYPYRTVGKVFGRLNGKNFSCSGASVNSPSRHLVWTAGHCISDGDGTFAQNLIFVPAYKNGKRPYGKFPAKFKVTTEGWHQDGDLRFDYAAFSVGKNNAKKKLRGQVGAIGFAWNQSRDLHWNAFGYPGNAPFDGQRIRVCQASHAADDLSRGTPEPMGIGCDQQSGNSGGPWIYRLGNGNFLNSNFSFHFNSQPEASYAPYFTTDANTIRCLAATRGASETC